MSVIHLIRHGKTSANRAHLYCGSTDVPLDAEGISEIIELRENGVYPCIRGTVTMTSGLVRAEETFRILFGCDAEISDPGFREMDFGEFEMRSYEQMKEDAGYIAWITDESGDFVCPGGESSNGFCKRVYAAFDRIAETGKDTVIVCHGGVISRIMERLFPDEGKNFYEWQPGAGMGYAIYNPLTQERRYTKIPK